MGWLPSTLKKTPVGAAQPAALPVDRCAAAPRVVLGQQRGPARSPVWPDLEPDPRIGGDVAYIAAPPAVLGDQPDHVAVGGDGHRCPAGEPGATPGRLEQGENPRRIAEPDSRPHARVEQVPLGVALEGAAGHRHRVKSATRTGSYGVDATSRSFRNHSKF